MGLFLMLSFDEYIKIGVAFAMAVILAFITTPLTIRLAKKIGIVDIPKDNRRMHNHPIPLLGGLSIIFAFVVTSIIFVPTHSYFMQILPGALIIATLGVIDDKKNLPAWPKFLVQCVAASIAVIMGAKIDFISGINVFGLGTINLHLFSIPLTILWIVGITNAVNLIDGLDGLADGVSTIACISMMVIAVLIRGEFSIAVLTAALAGGCVGLLPYNKNPAKTFMGDTGATFLGYTMSIISIQGLFKSYAIISVLVPFLILGIPIFDTASAILRRISEGKSPFASDRNHLHHKLIDMGLSQKQAVGILYAVSAVLGIIAIYLAVAGATTGWYILIGALVLISIIFFTFTSFRSNKKSSENQQEQQPIESDEKPKTTNQSELSDNEKPNDKDQYN